MNKLEQTIVENARDELAALLCFYQNRKAESQDSKNIEDVSEQLGHFYALHALLALGHQADSGISEEGRQELLRVENEHAEALRKQGTATHYFDGRERSMFCD